MSPNSTNISSPDSQHATLGCLFGLALGDALAAPVEFIRSVDTIVEEYGPDGPSAPEGNPAEVTDDTQMALAVGEALIQAPIPYTQATLEPFLRKVFIDWMVSPENNRAPGMTCMSACQRLLQGEPWVKATVLNSKGCGANMRVAPVGLLLDTEETTRAGIAQFQAAMTHGHATALAASDLTAYAVTYLAQGNDISTLPARLREYAESQRRIYHADWLEALWQRPGELSPEDFIERGWLECLEVLDRLDDALISPDRSADPCLATGGAWIAEEALATGLLCFLLYPDDPIAALRRATVTSGDSDSIACLTGAFAGAYHGISAWPTDWVERIEYKDRLQLLASQIK
jgi:ADP-ribosylglycohydrolase